MADTPTLELEKPETEKPLSIPAVEAVARVLNQVLAVLMLATLLLVTAQIVCRFVLSISVPWTEEVSRLMFIYLVYLGASIAYHENSMITIDTLTSTLGERVDWVKPLVTVTVVLIVGFMFFASIPIVISVWSTSLSTVDWISNGWAYLAFTISFGLMLLHSLAALAVWLSRRGGARP